MNFKIFFLTIMALAISVKGGAQEKLRPTSYNYQRAMEAVNNNDAEEALEYLNKELAENPKNGYAYVWLAMVRDYQDEYGQALSAADQALKFLPKKDKEYLYMAYGTRANVYCEIEDTVRALADYAAAIKLRPEETKMYEKRAQIYYERDEFDLADADYRRIIELDRGDVMGYMGIGRNRMDQKRWEEAIEQFDFVAKTHPDYSSANSFRAECYIATKDWDKASDDIMTALRIDHDEKAVRLMQTYEEPLFTRMKAKLQVQSAKEPNEAYWPFYLGVIHEYRYRYAQAIPFYEEANRRDENPVMYKRIATCYGELGQMEKCIATIDKALNMDSENYQLIMEKADALYELDRLDEALVLLDSVLTASPEDISAYMKRGRVKELLGDRDAAVEDVTMAIVLAPEISPCYQARGDIYSRQGKTTEAREDYQKVVELEKTPDDYMVSHYAYQALGNEAKAVEVIDTIIGRDSLRAGHYYDAACLYGRLNRKAEALRYLEKALEMGYRHFGHMAHDYDMDDFRDMPEYKALIEKYDEGTDADDEVACDEATGFDDSSVVEVPFTKENGGGICTVKCTINELPLTFVFDTGASSVSISQVEATFMMKNGYLNKNDFSGVQHFVDAQGNVSVGAIVNLKKVNFGGLELTNVKASVVQNQKAPLLLGQSVLGRLGRIEIDNANHILRITQNVK